MKLGGWKQSSLRWILVFFITSFMFFLIHSYNFKLANVIAGQKSENYVLAKIGFEFEDRELTAQMKKEGASDICNIDKFKEHQLNKRFVEFRKFLSESNEWRHDIASATFEDIYEAAIDLYNFIESVRILDVRTLNKIKEYKNELNLNEYYFIDNSINLIENIWIKFSNLETLDVSKEKIYRYIFDNIFSEYIGLDFDKVLTDKIRNFVSSNVITQKVYVSKDDILIYPGEKISSHHVDMINAMNKELISRISYWSFKNLISSYLLAYLIVFVLLRYLKVYFPSVFLSTRKLALMSTVMLLAVGLGKLLNVLVEDNIFFSKMIRFPIFSIFSAIIISALLNSRISIIVSITVVLSLNFIFSVDYKGFFLTNIISIFVVLSRSNKLIRKGDIFLLCLKSWIYTSLTIIVINLPEIKFENLTLTFITQEIFSALISFGATVSLTMIFLPIFEVLFSILTDVTLMRYLDPRSKLLSKLSIEAPGTYQHSVIVGNMSERAANAIGCNGLFCRAAALYHDIGKLSMPQYFVENQKSNLNIHDLLTPIESAQVIIDHIYEGVMLGKKYRLPDVFIDIIREHHGTECVKFFLAKQKQLYSSNSLDIKKFQYKGPRPHSREAAIIMISDCLEAISRSYDKMDSKEADKLIDQVISDKIKNNQLDCCNLTLDELAIVKKELKEEILAMHHRRVKYPTNED